ncbi:uncharacterized protein [Argopecten irradians]|uniref:uncharacterized protein n=1 Tax=Argopecten irradians TaxID=31199 RepID=UPI00371C54AB
MDMNFSKQRMMNTSLLILLLLIGQCLVEFCGASKVVNVCEESSYTLTCTNGIIINSARYGRFDQMTCTHEKMSSVGCGKDVQGHIWFICHGKTTCELLPSNGLYHDPCPGTHKYLEVNYTCTEESTTMDLTSSTIKTTTAIAAQTTTSMMATILTSAITTDQLRSSAKIPVSFTTGSTESTFELTTQLEAFSGRSSEITSELQHSSANALGPHTSSEITTTVTRDETSDRNNSSVSFKPTITSCKCRCKYVYVNETCSEGDRSCMIEALKQELMVQKSALSSYKRQKISVYDGRTSSTVMGVSGVAIIGSIISLAVIPDFLALVKFILCRRSQTSRKCCLA